MKKKAREATKATFSRRTAILEKVKEEIICRMMCIHVTSVHAKFGTSATKIERSKCSKCEALNKGDQAHIKCIALMKFIIRIIVFIAYLHIINER